VLAQFFGSQVDFRYAKFSGGQATFRYAEFSDGTVSFPSARFSGGQVDFGSAKFSGGQVDFSEARSWSLPPSFDFGSSPPRGVSLAARTEAGDAHSSAGSASDDATETG
jgi:hypothetical protein